MSVRIASQKRVVAAAVVAACAFLLSACSSMDRRAAVPPELRREATVIGVPNARFFPDQPALLIAEQKAALIREARHLGAKPGATLPTAHILSLSGGGDDGAFGAGLLVGWTAHGDRPSFKLVTGVSTGSLIAPFAFLGAAYDAELTDVYTNIDQAKVFEKRFVTAALTDDAMADTSPLYATISQHINERLMARIAEEYEKGRLLVLQTTDLDAGRAVLWNIGAIAKAGTPEALSLIRHIMLASAAIPAAFPPVLFDVEARGASYQELHVDGGAVSQAFLVPPSVDPRIAQAQAGYSRKVAAYVIRNGRLFPEWTDVERETMAIGAKGVSTMINYNGVGDFYRIYMETRRANASFNLAYIGEDFQADHKDQFDPLYMRALYRYAFDKAAKGYPWQGAPPGFAPSGR